MAELLLELLSEEIPARMQARATEDLKRLVTGELRAARLTFDRAEAYVTPRRLALVVDGLPKKQPDGTEEKRGPRAEAPVQAIQGFAGSFGIPPTFSKQLHDLKVGESLSIDEGLGSGASLTVEVRQTERGNFYFAYLVNKARPIDEVLHEILYRVVWNFPWPKSMRWGTYSLPWVRPLDRLLAIFDGRVPNTLSIPKRRKGPLSSGRKSPATDYVNASNRTLGHRFLAPKVFKVKDFADYKAKLENAKVILDPAERRAVILRQAKRRATRAGLELKDDPALLDEVTGLVEWPVVLMGRIDETFMDLPAEVLTTAMRHHQKYFALLDKQGGLASRFLMAANMETADRGKAIIAGNERVLRARLADARFFWDQDCKQSLSARATQLDAIVFHAKLGSLDEKIDRIQALAVAIAGYVPGADKDRVRSAARLAKADLVTGMVGEFPELQGIMGRYYALSDGENPEVADAIAEHYAPQGPNDACPSAPLSVAVALADKIDTLVGFWAIDEKPTGSKDPYALRRAALGIIRLIIENKLRLPLNKVFREALRAYRKSLSLAFNTVAVRQALLAFLIDRLKVALREKGVRHDLISAVFALGGEDDFVRLLARVGALEAFLETDDGNHLLVAYQRAANIVRIEEKRDNKRYDGDPLKDVFQQDEEQDLHDSVTASARASSVMLDNEDFSGAMSELAQLRVPVDRFFDRVTVNCDDAPLRANRLRLLSEIRATLSGVADFSKIEG